MGNIHSEVGVIVINQKRAGLLVGAAVVVAAVGTANVYASAASPAAGEPVYGGHMTIAGEAEVSNPWTPAAMLCDSYCFMRARTFFDTVGAFSTDGTVHGFLAESIEPNEEFTEWTVTIREGISFTDGTPVDAHAVEFNLQTSGTGIVVSSDLKDVAKVPDPENPDSTKLKIDVVDDYTLVIYTGKDGDPDQPIPWRTLDTRLTTQWGLIASPAWLEAVADDPTLATQPVGSGPFIVDSYSPRENLEVSRNPDYWMTDAAGNQLPYLDSITFRVIEDSEISAEALRAGDLDMFPSSNGLAIAQIQGLGDEYTVVLQDQFVETFYVLIDLDKPGPLQDRRVRCAMSLAIDRDELNASTTDDFNESANGLFSPGQQGFLEDNGLPMEQDLETAAAMIAEYEAETGEQVSFTLGHTPANTVVQAAELLMGWWTDIGIDIVDQTIPQNDFINLAVFGTPEFEAFIWRQHGGVHVDQQHVWWHSDGAFPDGQLALNFGRLRDPTIDSALEMARSASSEDDAVAAAETINRTFAEQCYYIPLNWLPWAALAQTNVHGIGELTLPDGTPVIDGAGFPGQYYMQTVWIEQ